MPKKRKARRAVRREIHYGQRLAQLRQERGITQLELAQRLGIDQPTVSDYERGKRRLHAELIAQLAQLLSVSADEFLGVNNSVTDDTSQVPQPFLRRLRKVDQLSERERRALLQTLDAFLERSELRKTAE